MLRRLSAILSTLVFGSGAAVGQGHGEDVLKARLDSIAASYTAGDAYMGAVLVVDGDRTLLDKGYGMADIERKIPNAPDVEFRIASLTKQFTAALILLLQQDGKLRIEDRVSEYLPGTPPAWEKITLANLLGHTSGIPNLNADAAFRSWAMSSHTPAEELALFMNKPLDFKPGSKYAYSNSNFIVLGVIIERVSGHTYAEMLRTRILEPLGLHNTGLDTDTLALPKRAQGYRVDKDGLVHASAQSMNVLWSAGAMYSTTGDLLLWERALFGGKLLNDASLKAMTTPGKNNLGFGVTIVQRSGVKVVECSGNISGFSAHLLYVPRRRIAIVILGNVTSLAPENIAHQLLDTVLVARPPPPGS